MRMSNNFFITRKEFPNDEDCISAKLLIKSGMIYKNDNGIYSYLPIGLKVLENIKKIIREEMKKSNADEVLMPSLVDRNIFETTNREKVFGKEMFNVLGRNNKEYSLCPTHEELFALLVRNKIRSYKDLHFTLFQLSNKFRDEVHPEYGLIRKKEFYMADAYSFDADESGLDISYDKMYQTFNNIFRRLNIDTMVVRADPDSMKGTSSEEFQVICDYGDNEVVRCKKCSYSTNIEDASSYDLYKKEEQQLKSRQLIYTPNKKSIKSLTEFLQVPSKNIIKSLIIKVDETYKMILLRADAELNVNKLKKVLKCDNIEIPSEYELEKMGTKVGYIGPIKTTMTVIADNEVKSMYNAICGSNKENYHYKNVTPGIDFKVNKYADIKLFNENSKCPKCKSECEIIRGIEVGHIFKLETNYSEIYNLRYLDEVNELNYVHMGSYGIGLDRCISAIVEKHNDEKGIIWPMEVAPYKVGIVIINVNDKETYKYASNLYKKLEQIGIDTILDDRKETVGIKFNDMDLMGIPIRITIGRKLEEGMVEFKLRDEEQSHDIDRDIIIKTILETIDSKSKVKTYN